MRAHLAARAPPDNNRSETLEVPMSKRPYLAMALLAFSLPALAHGNERGEAKAMINGKPVVIEYGRPMLAGRDMLGKAQVGQPWRMGKDAVTTLKTDADLSMGGATVPKGTYVLTATKVAEDKWQMNVATNDADKKSVADLTRIDEEGDPPTGCARPRGAVRSRTRSASTTSTRRPA